MLLGEVLFSADGGSLFLVDVPVGTHWIVSQQKEQVCHAHVRITYSLLLHWLLPERIEEVFESICALCLIKDSLFFAQIAHQTLHVVLICVLE